jgi:Transglutaminase-like superfamily
MRQTVAQLSLPMKVVVAVRLWTRFLRVSVGLRRDSLPRLIRQLRPDEATARIRIEPIRLGRIVERVLRIGPWRPRCLLTSLVLYRFLLEQGDRPEVVIGLPRHPRDKDAHAWIEIAGRDVGPPPGKSQHEELARYS